MIQIIIGLLILYALVEAAKAAVAWILAHIGTILLSSGLAWLSFWLIKVNKGNPEEIDKQQTTLTVNSRKSQYGHRNSQSFLGGGAPWRDPKDRVGFRQPQLHPRVNANIASKPGMSKIASSIETDLNANDTGIEGLLRDAEQAIRSIDEHRRKPRLNTVSTNQSQTLQLDLEHLRFNQIQTSSPSVNLDATLIAQSESQLLVSGGLEHKELTASVNRNDRLAIRKATRTQLNITSDSESAYATGRLVQTELEEVTGGGCYLLLELESQLLLYPTDQTLRGFGQAQPCKGVFTYQKQPIASPQVLTPALVERVGNNWRVQQLGTIAIPG